MSFTFEPGKKVTCENCGHTFSYIYDHEIYVYTGNDFPLTHSYSYVVCPKCNAKVYIMATTVRVHKMKG